MTAVRLDGETSMVTRLRGDFTVLPPGAVEQCVSDVRLCARHLGLDATPQLVEQVAREHLVGMVKSEPPSGRRG